jgi:hypothetical protein
MTSLKMQATYRILTISLFVLLICLSITSLATINEDIGRHLKLGEIIWYGKSVPGINLFSYTEPDHAFVNHHWLSEVVFYGLYSLGGFKLLIIFKVLIQLLSFALLFRVAYLILAKEKAINTLKFFALFASFAAAFFIFSERNDVRPEVFSLLFLCLCLYVLLSAKYLKNYKLLWALPFIELLWVNFHIYYFIGLFLVVGFAIDDFVSGGKHKKICVVLCLMLIATLINPNFLSGSLYFMNILRSYGFNVAENNSPFVLSDMGYSNHLVLYVISLAVFAASFLLVVKKWRQKVFELTIGVFFVYASLKMARNFGIYSVALAVLTPLNFRDCLTERRISPVKLQWLNRILILVSFLFVVFFSWQIVTNKYYEKRESVVSFGLTVPEGAQGGVDFIKDNKISGNVFNNFDVGSYLIWKLYPDQRVFVDGRPEAYSVDFFKNIYLPMQLDDDAWQHYSKIYSIRYIFFDHRMSVPETEKFINTRSNDSSWRLVYLDAYSVIFVRNKEHIDLESITKDNVLSNEKVRSIMESRDLVDLNSLGHLFHILRWGEAAIAAYNRALEIKPDSIYAKIGRGFVYARMTGDVRSQEKALEDLGFGRKIRLKTPQFYLVLGQVYFNLGDFQNARKYWDYAKDKDASYGKTVNSLEKLIPSSK